MKKRLSLMSVIILSLSILLGCTTTINEDLAEQVDRDIELAHTFIDLLDQGDYDEAYNLFDQKMQEEISEETLAELWDQLTSEYGEYLGHELSDASNMEQYLVVSLDGEFERMSVPFQVTIDHNSQIAGFYIN